MTLDPWENTQQSMLKIEDARPEDVETMRTITRDSWLKIYPNEKYGITAKDIADIDWYNPEGLAKRQKEIAENGETVRTFVLKNSKNETGGFCKASKYDDHGEINAMYLRQELQGKGLGKELLQKALEWLGSDKDIKLRVVAYNSHAIEFYKKSGFQETANKVSYDGTKLPNGKELPRIEMIKQHI